MNKIKYSVESSLDGIQWDAILSYDTEAEAKAKMAILQMKLPGWNFRIVKEA